MINPNKTTMKMTKTILAGAFSLGLLTNLDAGTVYMTGSTAMRGVVYSTLNAAGAVFDAAPAFSGRDGSSASGCNYMTFSGTVGGAPITVKCHWSGSEAGLKDVVTGQLETFLADSVTGYQSAKPAAAELDPAGHAADLAMADNSQAYSRTPSPVLTTGARVGVIVFTWVRNPSGLWGTTPNNVTDAQIRQALGGFAKLALFSGVAADTSYVYVSGRDNQSGTRVNAFGTTGFGIFTSPNQVELDSTGNMIDLSGVGDFAGDYGFASGGTLAGTLGADTAAKTDAFNGGTGFSVISYLSRGDADTAISKGAVELTLNGIASNAANIKEGRYTFWGNEYVYQKNGAGTDAQSVYSKLSSQSTGINNYCDGVKAIKLQDMHATRNGPTVDPVHN